MYVLLNICFLFSLACEMSRSRGKFYIQQNKFLVSGPVLSDRRIHRGLLSPIFSATESRPTEGFLWDAADVARFPYRL